MVISPKFRSGTKVLLDTVRYFILEPKLIVKSPTNDGSIDMTNINNTNVINDTTTMIEHSLNMKKGDDESFFINNEHILD